jgi:hypothetical protein
MACTFCLHQAPATAVSKTTFRPTTFITCKRAASLPCIAFITRRMHHRYYECNYAGFSAAFLDVFFNTYQAKFKDECVGLATKTT